MSGLRYQGTEVTYQSRRFSGEHLSADRPMTAQEILFEAIALLNEQVCQRSDCRHTRVELNEARKIKEQLEKVTAERDALERLLARRENGWR